MRVKEYDIEQLKSFPLSFVRNLDVQTIEEENLLQMIINAKVMESPIENMPQLTLEEQRMMDSPQMTPEIEARVQAQLDARRALWRARVTGTEVMEEEVPTDIPSEIPVEVAPLEEIPEVIQEESQPEEVVDPVIEAKTKFCEFCDSKGVRHLKICNRP